MDWWSPAISAGAGLALQRTPLLCIGAVELER
jgi:hypothetical protein